MFRAQPKPTTMSAAAISSAARGDAKPPDTSSDHGLPWNKPLATAEVASSAPVASPSASSSDRACRAPRPAISTGRWASASTAASAAMSSATGSTGAGGLLGARSTGAAHSLPCTSNGRFTRTVRRSSRAMENARIASSTAVSADDTRMAWAPTARAMAAWSIAKLEVAAVASAANTSSGVRLFAASVIPVIALVRPHLVHGERGHLSAHPGVGVGHGRGAALVPGADIPGTLIDQGVRDVEVTAPHNAERLSDAETCERPADSLRDPHRLSIRSAPALGSGCPNRPGWAAVPR